MSHEIDQTTGIAAVFTAGDPPWQELGRNVAEAVDSRQAITLAGLKWTVEQWPVTANTPDGFGSIPADGFVANVRTDTRCVLGVVSEKYRPFQNEEAFAFCDALVGTKRAKCETAGALRGGRRVWMLLKLPDDTLRAGPDDVIEPYLLLYNSFDGSSCLRALLTSIRVVCQNTLNLALRQGQHSGIAIPHRGDLQQRVQDARFALGLVRERLDDFGEEIEALRRVSMHNGRLRKFFDKVLPPLPSDATERTRHNRQQALEKLQDNFDNELNRLPGMRGSLWAAFNAVSEFADHDRVFRGHDEQSRRENRLNSIWFGRSQQLKQRAYELALLLAGVN